MQKSFAMAAPLGGRTTERTSFVPISKYSDLTQRTEDWIQREPNFNNTMAAAADKARFYLEQSVPELQELSRKKIFTAAEIASIAKKRSDFEHKVNTSRESTPEAFARYAQYEMNLETLRRKRVNRLGIKTTNHSGTRRIFFVLERATWKHKGDEGLWQMYIDYARKEKAYKRLEKMWTEVLRLHPAKPRWWVQAAQCALDVDADMTTARSYMQRGLRFNEKSKVMWVEYARLEMLYIAKIAGRRRVLGLDEDRSVQNSMRTLEEKTSSGDIIALPSVTAEDINPSLQENDAVDDGALQNLAATPALSGAIPIAIFEAAMDKFHDEPSLGALFFDAFIKFDQVPCVRKVLQHVLDRLESTSATSVATMTCGFKLPVVAVAPRSAEFPARLGQSLQRIKLALQQSPQSRSSIAEEAVLWLLQFAREDDMDQGVRKVVFVSLRQYIKALAPVTESSLARSRVNGIILSLRAKESEQDAALLEQVAGKALATDH